MSFTINVSEPYIPNNLNISHTETQYIIATDREFNNIIIDHTSQNSNELLHYYNNYTLTKEDILYYKVKLTFSNGTWVESNIDTIRYNKKIDIQVSTIYTPNISIRQSPLDVGNFNVHAETSELKLVYGNEDHLYTDWYVKTTSGDILWKKEFDENNLTKIIIPKNVFTGYGSYVIEARHRTANDESFLGRYVVINELTDGRIVLNSKPLLYAYTDNILEFNINSIIFTRLTWSLYNNGKAIYDKVQSEIMNADLKTEISIPGFKLIPGETYILEIEGYTYNNITMNRSFEVKCEQHPILYDRYIVNYEYMDFIKWKDLNIQLPNVSGSTKEYLSRIVPMYTGPKLIYFDLDIMNFNNEYIDVNKTLIDDYKIDYKANILLAQHIKYEETTNSKFKAARRYSIHTIKTSLTDITNATSTNGTVIDSNSEEINIGYGSYSPHYDTAKALTVGKEKNDSNYYLYDYTTGNKINNTELTNLTQYFLNVDKNNNNESQGMLHSLSLYNTSYLFIEYRGVFARLDLTDNSVISNNDGSYVNNYKTQLFQASNNTVICFKDNGPKLHVLFIDINTLEILKKIETDINYSDCIFVNTLNNELFIFQNRNTESSIYKIA